MTKKLSFCYILLQKFQKCTEIRHIFAKVFENFYTIPPKLRYKK